MCSSDLKNRKLDLNSYYQDAFLIPGSSPFNAKSRNVFLDIPNFLSVPRGLPVTSHLFLFKKVEGVSFEVPDQNTIIVLGIDKALVGQVAANIRAIKPPEPYIAGRVKSVKSRAEPGNKGNIVQVQSAVKVKK